MARVLWRRSGHASSGGGSWLGQVFCKALLPLGCGSGICCHHQSTGTGSLRFRRRTPAGVPAGQAALCRQILDRVDPDAASQHPRRNCCIAACNVGRLLLRIAPMSVTRRRFCRLGWLASAALGAPAWLGAQSQSGAAMPVPIAVGGAVRPLLPFAYRGPGPGVLSR